MIPDSTSPSTPSPPEHEAFLLLNVDESQSQDQFELMGSMQEKDSQLDERPGDKTGQLLVVVGLLVLVSYSWYLVLANDPASLKWFALHAPLQTLAVALFGLGILVLQQTTMKQPRAKARGLSVHQLLILICGFPSIVIGTGAIVYQKISHDADHFTTWHGFFGILAFSWMIVQGLVGGGTVWFNGRALGKNPKSFYKYHRLSGYLLFPLFLFVIYLGGDWSNWANKVGNPFLRAIAYIVAPLAILVGLWTRARLSKMPIF